MLPVMPILSTVRLVSLAIIRQICNTNFMTGVPMCVGYVSRVFRMVARPPTATALKQVSPSQQSCCRKAHPSFCSSKLVSGKESQPMKQKSADKIEYEKFIAEFSGTGMKVAMFM